MRFYLGYCYRQAFLLEKELSRKCTLPKFYSSHAPKHYFITINGLPFLGHNILEQSLVVKALCTVTKPTKTLHIMHVYGY